MTTAPDPLANQINAAIREKVPGLVAAQGWRYVLWLSEQIAPALRAAGVRMGDEIDVERLAQAVQDVDFASDLPASGQRTVSHHVRRKAVQYARQYAATPEAPHKHDWVDARNTVVASGEVCLVCGAVRATPEAPHGD